MHVAAFSAPMPPAIGLPTGSSGSADHSQRWTCRTASPVGGLHPLNRSTRRSSRPLQTASASQNRDFCPSRPSNTPQRPTKLKTGRSAPIGTGPRLCVEFRSTAWRCSTSRQPDSIAIRISRGRSRSFVWTDTYCDISVKMPDGVLPPTVDRIEPEVSLGTALRSLETQFAEIDLLLGHNLLAFDKPFLESEAKRAGIEPPRFPPCADSLHLSMLVDVAMPNRSLADLTERIAIDRGQPHRALSDAIATAAVIRELLDAVDMSDSSWQLAIGVLGSSSTARLSP